MLWPNSERALAVLNATGFSAIQQDFIAGRDAPKALSALPLGVSAKEKQQKLHL
jgi:hypothetical protein